MATIKVKSPYCGSEVWLWRAVEYATNTPLAYVFGTREHKYLEELLKLPEPFSIGTVYADNHFVCGNKIADHQLVTGKKNTQRMERNHLTLRTRIKRLARKTICFSKSKEFHTAVIGTFINLFFFHRPFDISIFIMTPPERAQATTDDLKTQGYIDEITDAIADAVAATSQIYVDALEKTVGSAGGRTKGSDGLPCRPDPGSKGRSNIHLWRYQRLTHRHN